jgi:hypothetical protein
MTEYVKSTNFTSKDSLSSGNPSKIIKGAEFDTEFNNIATAVATKADIADPTFTGTVIAPTPALSAAGTTVATVAAIQALYPVGSIYINAGVTTNPATLLGFGTWTAFGAGKVMVGLNGSDTLFDALEETGGSKDAIVVSHTHGITDPSHSHSLIITKMDDSTGEGTEGIVDGDNQIGPVTYTTNTATTGISVNTTGSSGTNANLQPYITVAMWKRTA